MKNQKSKRDSSTLEDVGRALDRELDRLMRYVNDTVVPAARDDSEKVLRKASARLSELADRLAAGRPPRGKTRGPKG